MFGPSLCAGHHPSGFPSGFQSPALPGLPAGLALDRLTSWGGAPSFPGLAAPSALTGQFEMQLAQSQQLLQLMTMILSLMQNRLGDSDATASSNAGGKSKPAPVGDGDSHGHAHGGDSSKAGSGNGSTVQRQGKPIGAHIAKQFDSMVAAAKKDGINITISSGFRSRAEQEKLYAAYKNGTGNLAAKPGTSNHESGDALDLGPPSAYAWLKQNAGQFGFKNKIASEPWHWSLTGY